MGSSALAPCNLAWPVARLILDQWPAGGEVADGSGSLPLHHAASRGHAGIARLLLEQWSDGVKVSDKNGWLPLHKAAEFHGDSLETVQLMVEAWPEGLTVAHGDGRTPLYVAAEFFNLQVARWIFQRSTPPTYTREMPCGILMELACNTSEATPPWRDAARDLQCSYPELLVRLTLQMWLDVCGGRPSYTDDLGMLADRLKDRDAKDE